MADLEKPLRGRRDGGGRAFVPYVTGGLAGVDAAFLRRLADAGADAIEVGIPFSDPVMDGGVIQEASKLALDAGATPASVLSAIADAALETPVAVMTYFNPVLHRGVDTFLRSARDAGVAGLIVPDLPVDEAGDVAAAARDAGIAPVQLAAPGSSHERLTAIAQAAGGFVYCVATYGVTGERESLATTAEDLVGALRPLTEVPLLVGVGIGTPEQAAEASRFADGAIVGSALVRRLVAGDPDGALELASAFRASIPS
jgi:tryptophan synthase alpha chain